MRISIILRPSKKAEAEPAFADDSFPYQTSWRIPTAAERVTARRQSQTADDFGQRRPQHEPGDMRTTMAGGVRLAAYSVVSAQVPPNTIVNSPVVDCGPCATWSSLAQGRFGCRKSGWTSSQTAALLGVRRRKAKPPFSAPCCWPQKPSRGRAGDSGCSPQ
jgi:hypothetical protein